MDQRFVKNSSVSFPSISDVCFKAYGILKNYALLLSLKENTVPPSCLLQTLAIVVGLTLYNGVRWQ